MKDQKWFEDMEQRIPHGEVRTRFAPSPTGYMHVGNLRTALYTYLIARPAITAVPSSCALRTPIRAVMWRVRSMSFTAPCAPVA